MVIITVIIVVIVIIIVIIIVIAVVIVMVVVVVVVVVIVIVIAIAIVMVIVIVIIVVIVIIIVIITVIVVVVFCCNSAHECGELLGAATLRLQSRLPPGFDGPSYDLSGWCFVEAWGMHAAQTRTHVQPKSPGQSRSFRGKQGCCSRKMFSMKTCVICQIK